MTSTDRVDAPGPRLTVRLRSALFGLGALSAVVIATVRTSDESSLALTALWIATAIGVASTALLVSVAKQLARQSAAAVALADKLSESEVLYRTTIDSLVDGVVIQDTNGHVLGMNEAAKTVYAHPDIAGLNSGEPATDTTPQLFNEDGSPHTPDERPVAIAVRTGQPVIGQMLCVRHLDHERWFRVNASPLHTPDDEIQRVVLTFTNVTEERRLQSDLAGQERRFRLALEHAPIGIALVAADGRFIEVNHAFTEVTKRPREILLACTFPDITHPDDLDADLDQVHSLLRGEADSYRIEKRYITPDGDTVHVLLAVAIVRPTDGVDPYFIAQVVDIEERHRAEVAQRNALERERDAVATLQELDRTKTNFVSTVSHELRTPLTSTIGYLELLSDGAGGPLTDRQHEMLAVAERNSQRLLGLIEDLLTLSRLEAGSIRRESTNVDVGVAIDTVVSATTPLADDRGVHLTSEVDPACGAILANESHFERVLLNLVGNALKFTSSGGTVTVDARPDRRQPGNVIIQVIDTGVGIPADEQAQLFTPFFRSSTAYVEAIPGTGLGLAITAELVAAYGGAIEVVSAVGEGSTFRVVWPTPAFVNTRPTP